MLSELELWQISWHTPTIEEIGLAMEIFRDLVEPTLGVLENLLGEGIDSIYVLLVQNASNYIIQLCRSSA